MERKMRRFIYGILMLIIAVAPCNAAQRSEYLFSAVNDGGRDMRVRCIIQLPDLRMAIATEEGIKIFDGAVFSRPEGAMPSPYELRTYDGYHHFYISHAGKYLWLKDMHKLWCVDTDRNRYVADIDSIIYAEGISRKADDIFGDHDGRIWYVSGDTLRQPALATCIPLDKEKGTLLDLGTDRENVYLFYRSGEVACHSIADGKRRYARTPYPSEEREKYAYTSHMVEGKDGFYQIRNGSKGGFFKFDPAKKEWTKLLESDIRLNTLAITDSTALISTGEGLMSIDIASGRTTYLSKLRTRSGNFLASGINSLYADTYGGLWLGLHNRGILYHHPARSRHISLPKPQSEQENRFPTPSSVFSEGHDGSVYINLDTAVAQITFTPDTTTISKKSGIPITAAGEYGTGASFVAANGAIFFNDDDSYNIYVPSNKKSDTLAVTPIISGLLVNGEEIKPGEEYDGNPILVRIPSRQREITLRHNQNFITIAVSSPVYQEAVPTYQYRLDGLDHEWHTTEEAGLYERQLRATYTALAPGDYTFRVKLSGSPDSVEATLKIHVSPPWWNTTAAWIIYVLAACTALYAASRIYATRTKRRIESEQREAHLLARIRQLIEEVDRYKAETPAVAEVRDSSPHGDQPCNTTAPDENSTGEITLSDADKAFVARAIETVERNLHTPGYSVAQLSSDLCMDRTGLYRKLNTLLDRSPSIFIRDIRLRYAAELLREGRLTVTEIAERTGFSTTSYMSKCFQERYGCRPSEYAAQHHE